MRLWGSGYIGKLARNIELFNDYRIKSGPYRILRHPLYIGNFFLVLGTILFFNPFVLLKFLLLILFVFEYSIIVIAEEYVLKNKPTRFVKFSGKNIVSEFSTILVIIVIYLIYFAIKERF